MQPQTGKVFIIGIGDDGLRALTEQARQILASADVIFAAEHTLRLVAELAAEKVAIGSELDETVRRIARERGQRRMVVLAGGDPLFYGVARYLCDRLGKEHFEVLPHVSSMQLAFARVKESWEEAYLTNLSARPLETVIDRIRTAETVGLFTSPEHAPGAIARELLGRGIDYFRAYVCENLGGPDERVTQGELADVAEMDFSPLNVMILVRKPDRPDRPRAGARFQRFGNPDDAFVQSKPKSGLITQAEVRALGLAQMAIRPGSVVWDIGAGSGSVSIEAAQLADGGQVYAVEQDAEDCELIRTNAERFGVSNVQVVRGQAPAVLDGLPAPDSVFVGGTGHEIGDILQMAYGRLKPEGRLVVNVATLESLAAAHATLRRLAGDVGLWMVNLARGTYQLGTVRFDAANPTFLLAVMKG